MPPRKALDMLDIGLAAYGKARGLEPPHAELNTVDRHYFDSLFANILDEAGDATENTLWNFGLELCFSCEDNSRLYGARREKTK